LKFEENTAIIRENLFSKGLYMVTQDQIENYLKRVPPMPKPLKETFEFLKNGDLSGAAKAASSDQAIIFYLKQVVNSAAYGFKNEVTNPNQIFSILGVAKAKQLMYAYMVNVISPEQWSFFKLKKGDFINFQTSLISNWQKIIKEESADENFLSTASIFSAGIVVADAIFGEHKDNVELIREVENLDLNTILKRVADMSFEELIDKIVESWGVDEGVMRIVKLSFGNEECLTDEISCKLAKYLHLLLFYELSKPVMLEAEVNFFIEFKPEFVSEVVEKFNEMVGVK